MSRHHTHSSTRHPRPCEDGCNAAGGRPVTGTPESAQALFRAMFDHTPLVDTRTPAQVRAQALADGWRRAR